jgi:hypothetical protein
MSVGAVPRPVLLGVIGVVLVAVVFFVTRKPGETTSSTPAPSQTPAPAQSPTAKPGSSSSANEPGKPQNVTPGNRSQTGAAGPGLPVRLKQALDAHKVVVVLFWNRNGVDDRSVKRALDSLPHGKSVAVFSDSVRHLSRYTRITAAASVSTTPSLVIVNRKGQAEVINGYLDRQTLAQYVRNARQR